MVIATQLMRRFRARRRLQSGYSLLEILIVVAIIGLLVTLVAPQLFGRLDQSRATTAQAQIRMLQSALDSFRLDMRRYPSESEGLTALIAAPGGDDGRDWRGPYLDSTSVPLDPWGKPYLYQPASGSDKPALYSYGADGKPGGDGTNADVGVLPNAARAPGA